MDYYGILGIEPNATQDEIKKSYRKLSLKYHPDRKNGNSDMFKKINEAYSILSDDTKRRNYDITGNNTLNFKNKKSMPDDIGDFISHLFQNQFSSGNDNSHFMNSMPNVNIYRNSTDFFKTVKKPEAIEKHIQISLVDSYSGIKYPVEIERWIIFENVKRLEKETIYVDIPKGIDTGEIITLENKGNIFDDKNKGDIKIYVKVINNGIFIRNGLNLILEREITLKESLTGFSIEFKHLNGKTYCIRNDEGDIIKPEYNKNIDQVTQLKNIL